MSVTFTLTWSLVALIGIYLLVGVCTAPMLIRKSRRNILRYQLQGKPDPEIEDGLEALDKLKSNITPLGTGILIYLYFYFMWLPEIIHDFYIRSR